MKRIAVAAAFLAIVAPALADRPATPAEQKVIYAAATQLDAVGGRVDIPWIWVADSMESRCGNARAVACGYGDGIVLSTNTAREARIYAHMLAKTSRRGRQRAMAACADPCLDVQNTAIHELVHVAREQHGTFKYSTPAEIAFEEGLAASVALDQSCPMERRVTGGNYHFGSWAACSGSNSGYDAWRLQVNAMGGPAWRLAQVAA